MAEMRLGHKEDKRCKNEQIPGWLYRKLQALASLREK